MQIYIELGIGFNLTLERYKWCQRRGILWADQGDPRIRTKELKRVPQKNPGATRSSTKEQYQDQLTLTFAYTGWRQVRQVAI